MLSQFFGVMSATVLERYIVRRNYLCDILLSVFSNIETCKSRLVEMGILVTMTDDQNDILAFPPDLIPPL